MKFTKYLIGLCAMAFTAFAAEDIAVYSGTAGSPVQLLSAKGVVNYINVIANTTNNVIYLYDAAAITEPGGTSVAVAAYPKYFSYSTNYESLTTNQETGYIYTNKFVGTYTTYTNTTAATNERPKVASFAVAASTTRKVTLNRLVGQGLIALPTASCTIEVSTTPY